MLQQGKKEPKACGMMWKQMFNRYSDKNEAEFRNSSVRLYHCNILTDVVSLMRQKHSRGMNKSNPYRQRNIKPADYIKTSGNQTGNNYNIMVKLLFSQVPNITSGFNRVKIPLFNSHTRNNFCVRIIKIQN